LNKRKQIERQITELHKKAIQRPSENGPVVGFGATVLAAHMQIWLLKADFEQRGERMSTLLEALQIERNAIYRGTIGCYFVEDNTPVGNGYTVFFNDSPATPIEYTNPVFSSGRSKTIRLPFIVPSEEDGHWYCNQKDLLSALGGYCDDPAWYGVSVREVENGNN
jgi:hypothetical protein